MVVVEQGSMRRTNVGERKVHAGPLDEEQIVKREWKSRKLLWWKVVVEGCGRGGSPVTDRGTLAREPRSTHWAFSPMSSYKHILAKLLENYLPL